MKTLVIGGGGLIGSSLCESFSREFGKVQTPSMIPWSNTEKAISELRKTVKDFLLESVEERWIIAWCAGRGGFFSTSSDLESEKNCMICVLDEISNSKNNNGIFFLTSSAGAIYTESSPQVFTENSSISISNEYGRHKLNQEIVVGQFARDTKTKCVIGRLVSIYGPNQNLQKSQGLISRLCLSTVYRQVTDIYVPLGTTRNYLYADDAAKMITDYLHFVDQSESPEPVFIKIFCSDLGVSISSICRDVGLVAKQKVLVNTHVLINGKLYPPYFNIRSVSPPDLSGFCQTTLLAGIGNVYLAIHNRYKILGLT